MYVTALCRHRLSPICQWQVRESRIRLLPFGSAAGQ